MNKQEFMSALSEAKTWREVQVTVAEAFDILSVADDNESELLELRDKVAKLTETNRQLRAENKKLKSK